MRIMKVLLLISVGVIVAQIPSFLRKESVVLSTPINGRHTVSVVLKSDWLVGYSAHLVVKDIGYFFDTELISLPLVEGKDMPVDIMSELNGLKWNEGSKSVEFEFNDEVREMILPPIPGHPAKRVISEP